LSAFEYIDRLQTISDPAQIQSAFIEALAEFGIVNFALLEIAPDPDSFQRNVINDSMPDGWKRRYFEQQYSKFDPCVAEVMTNLEPFLWSEALSKSRAEKVQRQIFHEAAEFQLNEGMCIPIYGPNRYVAFATLTGAHMELAPSARTALHVMALYTHNRLVKLVRNSKRSQPALTPREADCLRWVAQGKSDWEIGEILKISERTAHWYIECAKRKLGVATRIQAVMNAVANNLLFF
jgi:LuxR family transcriptional regulator, quorum-sensing system regulator BjaR1